MDYVASMEPPSSSAGALKSTSSHNPRLRGQVTLFMSCNLETSQRRPPLWAARHQTMHQNIKSIHPHCIPVFWDERWGKYKCLPHHAPQIYIIANSDTPSISCSLEILKVTYSHCFFFFIRPTVQKWSLLSYIKKERKIIVSALLNWHPRKKLCSNNKKKKLQHVTSYSI